MAAVVRPAPAALLAALAVLTTPAAATVHHHAHGHARAAARHASGHHTTAHHAGGHHASKDKTSKDKARHPSRESAKPAGVTGVPAGGMKLYCPAGRNPLLIRKSTQGAGTTVTVVCR